MTPAQHRCVAWLGRLREEPGYAGSSENHAEAREVGQLLLDASSVHALGIDPQVLVDVMHARHGVHREDLSTTAELAREAVAFGLGSGRPDLVRWGQDLAQEAAVPLEAHHDPASLDTYREELTRLGAAGALAAVEDLYAAVTDSVLSDTTWTETSVHLVVELSRAYAAVLREHGRGAEADLLVLELLRDLEGATDRMRAAGFPAMAWIYRQLAQCTTPHESNTPRDRIRHALLSAECSAAVGEVRERIEMILLAGELELTDGDAGRAAGHLETVYREADWHQQLSEVVAAAVGLSARYLRAGRPRDAAELFVQILARVEPDRLNRRRDRVALAQAYVELALLHRLAGRTDNYRQLLDTAQQIFHVHGEAELARRALAR